MWMLPVIRGISFENDEEAEAYLVADNRLTEIGGWMPADLAAVLSDHVAMGEEHLRGTGFDTDDVDELLRQLGEEGRGDKGQGQGGEQGEQEGDASSLVEKWEVAKGKVWTIPSRKIGGRHHVLACASPDDEQTVTKLLTGKTIALIIADPDYSALSNPEAPEEMDNRLSEAFRCAHEMAAEDAAWYTWSTTRYRQAMFEALLGVGIEQHQEIVWPRRTAAHDDGDYQEMHETCFYGWRERHNYYAERNLTTVWRVEEEPEDMTFPGSKPVELFRIPILSNTRIAETIYLPWATTGPGLSAAEYTTRIAIAIEPDLESLAMALERLELIGLTPERADDS